jgi:hypothetical protein
LKRVLLSCCFLFFAASSWATSTPNVPVDDPVYRDIDKLVAAGLVKDAIYGQRPWSRREIARMVSEAMGHRTGTPLTPDDQKLSLRLRTNDILDRLRKRFREELVDLGTVEGDFRTFTLHPLESARFDVTALDSPFRRVPTSNGLGRIDADINPFVAYRGGRHYVDGETLGLETVHSAQLTRYVSLLAHPRFETLIPATGSNDANLIVQELYAAFAYRDFRLQAGRDELVWGQGEFGGLIFSNNARPMDMLRLGSQSPFFLPWIFRYLGPNSMQVFFADLGPERDYPHSILSGYKWSIRPVSFLELGLQHTVMMGGDGANDPSFWEAIGEFTGILSAVTKNNRSGAFTDRLFSLETRITLPFLRNSILYGEIGFDDTNSETNVLFEDDAMYYGGIYIPRLTNDGSVDLRLEYKHVSAVSYRHGVYGSGFILNRRIIGDELGPDADGVSAKIRADLASNVLLNSEIAYERRDSDDFATIDNAGGITDIFKVRDGPAEHRLRFQNAVAWDMTPKLRTEFEFGYEHVFGFGFAPGNDVDNFLGGLTLTYRP